MSGGHKTTMSQATNKIIETLHFENHFNVTNLQC